MDNQTFISSDWFIDRDEFDIDMALIINCKKNIR